MYFIGLISDVSKIDVDNIQPHSFVLPESRDYPAGNTEESGSDRSIAVSEKIATVLILKKRLASSYTSCKYYPEYAWEQLRKLRLIRKGCTATPVRSIAIRSNPGWNMVEVKV
jgi:hypothetical protein